jgi:large subunit ribosomal protein L5
MARLKEHYQQTVVPALQEKFGDENVNALPYIRKITVNVGTGKHFREADQYAKVEQALKVITGQKPVERKTNKSISQFRLRSGMTVAQMVTLRGDRMYDFLDRLITIAFPRTRDFRGIGLQKIDEHGNLNFGIPEHNIFPELSNEELEISFGMQVNITVVNSDSEKTRFLLEQMNFPFSNQA